MYRVANTDKLLYKLKTCVSQKTLLFFNIFVCFFYGCGSTEISTAGLEMKCNPENDICPEYHPFAGQEKKKKKIKQLDLQLLTLNGMTTGPWHFCS